MSEKGDGGGQRCRAASAGIETGTGFHLSVWMEKALLLILTCGAAFLYLFRLDEATLYCDELWRANAIMSWDVGGIRNLPPAYVAVERLFYEVLGRNAWAFRLLPALAGVGTVPAVWVLARRSFPAGWALFSAYVVCVHPEMIGIARMGKELSLGHLFAPLIFAALIVATERRSVVWGVVLAGVCAAGMLFSWSVIFVAGAAVGVLFVRAIGRDGTWMDWKMCVVVGVPALLVTMLMYGWALGGSRLHLNINNPHWTWPPVPWDAPVAALCWLWHSTVGLVLRCVGYGRSAWSPFFGVLLLLVASVGVSWERREKRVLLGAILCGVCLTVVAAFVRMWPFGGYRTMLFLIPLLAPCAGLGIRRLVVCFVDMRAYPGLFVLLVPLLFLPLLWAPAVMSEEYGGYDLHALSDGLEMRSAPGALFVIHDLPPEYVVFYLKPLPPGSRIVSLDSVERIARQARSGQRIRVWIIGPAGMSRAEVSPGESWVVSQQIERRGCRAILFVKDVDAGGAKNRDNR